MKKTKILNIILPIITIVFLLVLWVIISSIGNNQYLFPPIGEMWSALVDVVSEGKFYSAYFATLLRSLIAFLISFTMALGTALLCRKSSVFERVISPIIKIMRALPTIAVVLVLVLWTNSLIAPVIVTLLVVFPTLFTNVKESLANIDKGQIEMCRVFGVSQKEILLKVELPQIAPSMLDAIGSGLSLNLKLMVAAEVLASTYTSLGNLLNVAKYNFEIATMLAIVLLCVITGLLIELIFGLISKRVGKWQ